MLYGNMPYLGKPGPPKYRMFALTYRRKVLVCQKNSIPTMMLARMKLLSV